MDLIEARLNRAPRHPWELARLDVVTSLLASRLAAMGTEGTRILDIGCGDAWLVEQLAARFPTCQFVAVDTALEDEELAEMRWRLQDRQVDVFRSLDDALAAGTDPIGMVLLLDVLEHIADDEKFLFDLRSRPGITRQTQVLATVPAWQRLYCSHDKFLGHHRRYTAPMLCERLSRNGFAAHNSGYFFSGLLAARSLQVLAERFQLWQPTARGVGRTSASSLFDSLLQKCLLLDYRLGSLLRQCGFNPPGLSAFALATAGQLAPSAAPVLAETPQPQLCLAR